MPLNIPVTRKEVFDRMRTDAQSILGGVNVFLRNTILTAFLSAIAGRMFDLYSLVNTIIERVIFPNASILDYLERWGSLRNVSRNAATAASGTVNFTGVSGTSIPVSTIITTSEAAEYLTLADATISANTITLSSLTRSGSVATATTSGSHNLASNMHVVIAGASQSAYNGTFTITVTSLTTFTYVVAGSPTTPATGTIAASANFATVTIQSSDTGASTNLESGTNLTLDTPITDVDDAVIVTFNAIGGGTDIESDTDLQKRIDTAYKFPVAFFNKAQIEQICYSVAGVTRVTVQEITPDIGQVTIYFLRDNDTDSIFPNASEVAQVVEAVNAIRPAHVDPADVIIASPTGVTVPVTIDALVPATSSMRNAIRARLADYFRNDVNVGTSITLLALNSIIFRTTDPNTGVPVTSFSITAPSGTTAIAPDELAVLGTVSFT
jgi:uncharacterized phage protein gp47/JayE